MKKIAFLSQKGGSGKTTLWVHLATCALRAGENVVILDLDPQASAAAWGQARKSKPPTVMKAAPSALADTVRKIEASLIFIDTAPHTSVGIDVVASSVDLLLIPCRPSAFDLVAIASSVQIAKAAGTPAAFVLNGANSRSPEYNEARKVLERHGFPVCPVAPGQRTPFVRAISTGRAVTEFAPRDKASEEIESLWKWVSSLLEK